MSRTGRPKIEINQDLFEGLCRIHCTEEEICGLLNLSGPTLTSWCKRTYHGKTFFEVHERFKAGGRMSLRRAMFKNAENGNAQIQVWLSKQFLGMREEVHNYNFDVTRATDEQLDRIAAGENPQIVMASSSGRGEGETPPLTSERVN